MCIPLVFLFLFPLVVRHVRLEHGKIPSEMDSRSTKLWRGTGYAAMVLYVLGGSLVGAFPVFPCYVHRRHSCAWDDASGAITLIATGSLALGAAYVLAAATLLLVTLRAQQPSTSQQPSEVSTTISSDQAGAAPRFAVPEFIADDPYPLPETFNERGGNLLQLLRENAGGLAGGHWHQGALDFDQFFINRPFPRAHQYRTPLPGFYLCGAGSHPGGGLMGHAGRNAATQVLAGA